VPRNGVGTFVPVASSFNPAVPGTVIESGSGGWEATFADMVAGLTQSFSKDGQTVATGSFNMGGSYKISSLANGTAAADAATVGQIQSAAYTVGTVGGTADVITLAVSPMATAYAAGQTFQFTATGTNTTAVTVNVSSLGAKTVQANSAALVAGDIVSGRTYVIRYDGTNFQLFSSRAAVSHTADIANNAVTFAKMQAITDGVLLGASGGTAVEEITVGNGLQLSSNTLSAAPPKNLIINGGFQLCQRLGVALGGSSSASGVADDTYTLDRHYTLTQTASITVGQSLAAADLENGSVSCGSLVQSQAVAQRMGIATIIEGFDSIPMRGQTLAYNARIYCTSSQAIRYAILEWTGTVDSVTSDVVNNWTSGTYTAGNFFLGANLTVAVVGSTTPSANTWTTLPTISAAISSSCNNLIFFVWTEGTAAQNVTLRITREQAIPVTSLPAFVWPEIGDEILRCQRYYQKSFPQTTLPAQNSGVGGPQIAQGVGASTANNGGFSVSLPVTMRTAPTVTLYNPSAANAQARNVTTGADCTVTTATAFAERVNITFTSPAGSAVGNGIQVHYTADAEL